MPETLPRLDSELNFVYVYVGAPDRVFEYSERLIQLQYITQAPTISLWLPDLAPVRKTVRFKALMRNAGLVDYWRERGWPDLCRPVGADDFECN